MATPASNSQSSADKKKRDSLLDDLQTATDEWATAETTRIENEVSFLKSVLRAHGGAALTDSANVDKGTVLAADSIGYFLRGE